MRIAAIMSAAFALFSLEAAGQHLLDVSQKQHEFKKQVECYNRIKNNQTKFVTTHNRGFAQAYRDLLRLQEHWAEMQLDRMTVLDASEQAGIRRKAELWNAQVEMKERCRDIRSNLEKMISIFHKIEKDISRLERAPQ